MPTTTTSGQVAVLPPQRQFRSRALAVTAAVLAALSVWAVAVPLLGVHLVVHSAPGASDTQTISVGLVLAVSLLASLLGWGLIAALERLTQRPTTIWTVAASVVLGVSLAGPITAAVTTGAKIAMVLLHLTVAAVLISLMRRTARTR